MNPVPVMMLLFINSLVKQCKHKNFLLQVHYIYWWVEGQQQTVAPLVEEMLWFLAMLYMAAQLKTTHRKAA
jgi:hypothetical protein